MQSRATDIAVAHALCIMQKACLAASVQSHGCPCSNVGMHGIAIWVDTPAFQKFASNQRHSFSNEDALRSMHRLCAAVPMLL